VLVLTALPWILAGFREERQRGKSRRESRGKQKDERECGKEGRRKGKEREWSRENERKERKGGGEEESKKEGRSHFKFHNLSTALNDLSSSVQCQIARIAK